MNFNQTSLDPRLLAYLHRENITECTPIQDKALPTLLAKDTDFVGEAPTGTGKTLAFALPLLQKCLEIEADAEPKPRSHKKPSPFAIVMTPTRELASQVSEEINKAGRDIGIKALAVTGGSSYSHQKRGLSSGDYKIVVGTPGRVMDMIDQGYLNLSESSYAVLDEADEMLKFGFYDDIIGIIDLLPELRKIWLFSATMPPQTLRLIEGHFSSPTHIKVGRAEGVKQGTIEQIYYPLKKKFFMRALARILWQERDFYGMIFCQTRVETKEVADWLALNGFKGEIISGDLKQEERNRVMSDFKSRRNKILIATDVAARGIDVDSLTHVINFGLPNELASYVHRIGRTGRAGQSGKAVTLVEPGEFPRLKRLEKILSATIKCGELPDLLRIKTELLEERLGSLFPEHTNDSPRPFADEPIYKLFLTKIKEMDQEKLTELLFDAVLAPMIRRVNQLDGIGLTMPEPTSYRRDYGSSRGRPSFSRERNGYSRDRGDYHSSSSRSSDSSREPRRYGSERGGSSRSSSSRLSFSR